MDNFADTYKVYIKLDIQNRIIAVNSSGFLTDTTDWIKIDEGLGDKYHHAQGNYFSEPLFDENGIPNYKYVDGTIFPVTSEEKTPDLAKINAAAEITQLKNKLAETDYIAVKIAEGAATVEEYADKISQRAEWRQRINELEAMITLEETKKGVE